MIEGASQPLDQTNGRGGDDAGTKETIPACEVTKRMYRCRTLYRWKVPKVMLELKSVRKQLATAQEGITKHLRDDHEDADDIWDLGEQANDLAFSIMSALKDVDADGTLLVAGPTSFDLCVLQRALDNASEVAARCRDLRAAVDEALGWNRKRN